MKKRIETDLVLVIEELDALAEVIIPAIDLNDLRRDPEEYLENTVADLYDRVAYMVRSEEMVEGDNPCLSISLQAHGGYINRDTWLPSKKERKEWLKRTVVELFHALESGR